MNIPPHFYTYSRDTCKFLRYSGAPVVSFQRNPRPVVGLNKEDIISSLGDWVYTGRLSKNGQKKGVVPTAKPSAYPRKKKLCRRFDGTGPYCICTRRFDHGFERAQLIQKNQINEKQARTVIFADIFASKNTICEKMKIFAVYCTRQRWTTSLPCMIAHGKVSFRYGAVRHAGEATCTRSFAVCIFSFLLCMYLYRVQFLFFAECISLPCIFFILPSMFTLPCAFSKFAVLRFFAGYYTRQRVFREKGTRQRRIYSPKNEFSGSV